MSRKIYRFLWHNQPLRFLRFPTIYHVPPPPPHRVSIICTSPPPPAYITAHIRHCLCCCCARSANLVANNDDGPLCVLHRTASLERIAASTSIYAPLFLPRCHIPPRHIRWANSLEIWWRIRCFVGGRTRMAQLNRPTAPSHTIPAAMPAWPRKTNDDDGKDEDDLCVRIWTSSPSSSTS